jgi:hypothetical protein
VIKNGSKEIIVTMPEKIPEMSLNTEEGLCIGYGSAGLKKCIGFAELRDVFYTKSEYPIVDSRG